jgi:outer membrane autotransporter protein
MYTHKQAGKLLAAAVLCSLFTASPVWATNLTSNVTVTPDNNQSNTTDSYESIAVHGTEDSVIGINMSVDKDMIVYVTGDKVLDLTSTRTMAQDHDLKVIGVNNTPISNGITTDRTYKTLNIKGSLSGVVEAKVENEGNSAIGATAIGINIENGKVTSDAIGDLTVTATSHRPQNTSQTTALGLPEAYGVQVIDNGTFITGDVGNIIVAATIPDALTLNSVTGPYNASAGAIIQIGSHGMVNKGILQTGNIGSLNVNTMMADFTAGAMAVASNSAIATADLIGAAEGLLNGNSGNMLTGNIGSLVVTATTGKVIAGNASGLYPRAEALSTASAYGLENLGDQSASDNKLTAGNIGRLVVTATSSDATAGIVIGLQKITDPLNYAKSNAAAYGLYNSYGTLTVGDVLGATITATSGNATVKQLGATISASANAYGIYAEGSQGVSTVNVLGNMEITNISATAGTKTDANGVTTPDIAKAYSLYATGAAAIINVGVDTKAGYPNSNGKTIKLAGDVFAGDSGTNNVILANSDSYLQGNILADGGTNNIMVTNGATWKPVYDNRYGSFSVAGDASTYSLSKTVQDVTAKAKLTLSDKGKIDLTWDNETRDPNANKRTLTITSLSGDGGVLVVNTNLANNVADEFIINDNAATNLGIDVNYDPALATSGLAVGNEITGSAKVLTVGSGTIPTVTGVADSYNTYEYTPTITATGKNTWAVTKLTITNSTGGGSDDGSKTTITSPSTPMREARHQRMAMHNLWVNGELNNMEKRMGDLRAVEPAEAGIWARYEHNKLEKGSDATLKYNYFQVGFDKDFKGATGTFYRGGAFSYAKGTGEYEVGNGDLKEGTLTLYQTWVGKNGNYYDVVAKTGKLMNNYDAINTANKYSADYHSWAYSISGEVGKRIRYANGLYVEPQAEFTLGRINGADYTTSTGMDVSVDKQNIALARLGVAVGKEIKNVGSYYAKASYYHDFGGGINLTASDSTTNPFSYSENSAKNWCVFTLGGDVKAGKNCNIFGELSKFTGELSNKVQVNIGARWSF